jgi:hypothetical protein
MRVYINNPERFSLLNNKIVIVMIDSESDKTVIRKQDGDFHSVNSDKLEFAGLDIISDQLMNNSTLLDAALEEGLVDVGDYNYADTSYLNYTKTHY